jgi:hypothetical protein
MPSSHRFDITPYGEADEPPSRADRSPEKPDEDYSRSGHVHDEAERQMSTAEFMADAQERSDIAD